MIVFRNETKRKTNKQTNKQKPITMYYTLNYTQGDKSTKDMKPKIW